MSVRRRWTIGIAVALLAAVCAAIWLVGIPVVSVGTAYKAKMLCSDIFVAGRRLDDAMADVEIDDLRALRAIRADVNRDEGTVTARLFPLAERRARFQGELGCVLEPRGTKPTQRVAYSAARSGPEVAASVSDTIAALPASALRAVETVLADAFSEPDSAHPRRTRAVVVMQHGTVVAERYAAGVSAGTPLPGWSMAKSVLSALVGVAVKEGKLAVDGPVHLQAWNTPGDSRSRVSVGDLLRMSSGLRFDEGQADPRSDVLRMLFDAPDMGAFAASRELEVDPGARWKYSTGTSMIVSRILRDALGDDAYRRFPRAALFDRLGMRSAVMEVDPSGTFVASSYMYATAREWARFGQLYLQDGIWMGERVLPEGWVAYTRTPAPADPRSGYGAHFWLAVPNEYRSGDVVLPADAFHAVGHEAQFVTIVPSRDVVIVRLGRTRYPGAWKQDRFIAAMLAALPP